MVEKSTYLATVQGDQDLAYKEHGSTAGQQDRETTRDH